MNAENKTDARGSSPGRKTQKHPEANLVYGLGFLGALVYFITTATSFWTGLLGVLKAILWPGFLVYELMKYLGM